MPEPLPDILNVLVLTRGSPTVVDRIKAVAPDRLNVTYAWPDFVPEMMRDWEEGMMRRYAGESVPTRSPEECEALLREAHVMYMAVPFPKTAPSRAPNLRWAHFSFAGVSNLADTPWWGLDAFPITSSRGWTNALPIAETVIGATFMFAKRLDWAVEHTTAGNAHEVAGFPGMKLIAGKTMGIIGLGGIGGNVARLAKGLGMRVIATRRSATERQTNVDGVDELFPPQDLPALMAESDFIAVCAMLTPETQGMVNREAFEAVKPGAYFLNVARGEIVDDDALIDALRSDRLAGAYLDVWRNDFAFPPSEALLNAPNIVFTPHVSGRVDQTHAFATDLFIQNLHHLLNNQPLENIINWHRGY
jgi:phosphoglycerate dehydrogenase-like enzyme